MEPMTKERLESYQKNVELILDLERKIKELPSDESMIGNSVIFDYRKGYAKPQTVVGYDQKLADAKRQQWEKRLYKLRLEVEMVETWVDQLPEGDEKRCIELVYIDGMTMKAAGRVLHMDRSTVSKKISNTLKLSPNSRFARL